MPLWKRPEVTKFCFDGMLRLIASSKHEIDVTCVLSETEFIPICEEYGFDWIFENNLPLGKKINSGIKSTLKLEYDYLMMMNSDDIIETELLDNYYDQFIERKTQLFGINRVTYVNFYTHEAREVSYDYSLLGIAKMIHRNTVEQFNGELYPAGLNKSLDDNMLYSMTKAKIFPDLVKYDGMLAMDFKSEVNIWPWEKFKHKGEKVCYKPKTYAEGNLTVR